MASHQTDILISLNEIDKSYLANSRDLSNLEKNCQNLEKYLAQKLQLKSELDQKLSEAKKNRNLEQAKLDQEQVKISDRRKQISAMGGAKSAKLVEREMGIAKKTIETLEQNVLNAIQLEEDIEKKFNDLLADIQTSNEKFEEAKLILSEKGSSLKTQINHLLSQKNDLTKKLDERTALLYKRVETRYRGDAIAFAEAGACKSCFRALPAQTFNQIIAGYNLIQCPGCSRLLVYAPKESTEEKDKDQAVVNQ